MFVACLTIQFHLPGCTSLKEKRFVLKSLKDRLRNRFNVALCETGHQDKWQRSEIAVVSVAGSRKGIDKTMQSIITFIENEKRAVIIEIEKEIF